MWSTMHCIIRKSEKKREKYTSCLASILTPNVVRLRPSAELLSLDSFLFFTVFEWKTLESLMLVGEMLFIVVNIYKWIWLDGIWN
jgi:hypothetical protein